MYTSAGIPGTGIYAIHHYRSSLGEHPKAAGKVGVSPLSAVRLSPQCLDRLSGALGFSYRRPGSIYAQEGYTPFSFRPIP